METIKVTNIPVVLDEVNLEDKPVFHISIDETKDIVDFFADVKIAYKNINADGKVNLMDIPYLFQPAKSLFGAIKGIEAVPFELQDIDLSEAEELVAYVVERFEVSVGGAKQIIAEALKAIIAIKNIVYMVIEE